MSALRLLTVGLLLVAPLLPRPAAAQAPDPSFAPPTGLYAPGAVYALGPQQADGQRVVAGSFIRANGLAASNLARLDASGAVDQVFAQNVGNAIGVFRVLGLPNGQYLLGANGGTVAAGGSSGNELLRLNANGTADASFSVGNGPTAGAGNANFGYGQNYAVQPDGKIVVVGYFDTFNGQPAAEVVRLNPNGSVDPSFSVGAGADANATTNYNVVDAVAVQPDGKILVSGTFTAFNGQPAVGLVRLTATGSVDASFASPFTNITAATTEPTTIVLQPDGKILVAGALSIGSSTPTVVRLNANGSVDASFASTALPASSTYSFYGPSLVLQPDGKILVIGTFYLPNNKFVARLTADGTLDNSFQLPNTPNNLPYAVGLQADGKILVGGSFTTLNGQNTGLGRLTSTGGADATYSPRLQVTGGITALARQADGRLVIGGNFTELNGQPVAYLARLSATGAVDAAFAANASGVTAPVNALVVQADDKILVGSNGVQRFTTTGSPDASFSYFLGGGTVMALALQPDGRIMVASPVQTSTYSQLFRITSTGAYDNTFSRDITTASGLGVPNQANAVLVQPDGRIVVAEDFRVAGTASYYTSRVVRYTSTGALDTGFNNLADYGTAFSGSPANHRLNTLALQPDGKILVGGQFGSVGGTAQGAVARLTTAGQLDASFSSGIPTASVVYALAVQPNGRILVGGNFSTGSNVRLARLLATGQPDNSFAGTANPNGSVRSLLLQPNGGIVVGGYFSAVGSTPAFGVARLTAPNVLAVAAPAVAARTQAWPVPARSVLHVAPDAAAHPQALELLDGLGRTIRTQAATGSLEYTFDVAGLPAGLYLLRVQYAAGTVTRQLMVE